jgi:predicted NBD/HSP70 family sugar kinase
MINRIAKLKDLRVSEKSIFRLLFISGPATKNTISTTFDSSLSTVTRFLDNLLEYGLISEKHGENASNTKGAFFGVKDDALLTFSGYITSDFAGIGLVDLGGRIHSHQEMPITKDVVPDDVLEMFSAYIQDFKSKADPQRFQEIIGIGMGCIGPIRKKKGFLLSPYHIDNPAWKNIFLKDLIEMKVNLKTWVNNMTDNALIGELFFHDRNAKNSASYVLVDKGIGCAVYNHGTLGLGTVDTSSTIGHNIIDFHGRSCVCGKIGCLETYASIDAIHADLKEDMAKSDEITWESTGKLDEIRKHFENPTEKDRQVREDLVQALAVAVSNFIILVRPEICYFGGRTVEAFPWLIKAIETLAKDRYLGHLFDDIQFRKSSFNRELLLKGGAGFAFNEIFSIINIAE